MSYRQETYVCDHCGNLFVSHKRSGKWRFCNRACLTAARKSGGVIAPAPAQIFTRVCALPECGKTFSYVKHNKKQQYCDRRCAGLARRSGGLIAQKVENTTLQNHGVRRFFCDQQRMKKVMQLHHGVDNASQIPGLRKESWKKAHETKKRNGTYKSSKIERAFCVALEQEGHEVEKQRVMLGKPIDVHLVKEDIYIQIDGRYWHGLDRGIEVIRRSSYPRDRSILGRWTSDRQQDEQFREHGLKLVRVTDHEAKEWLKSNQTLLLKIKEKLMNLTTLRQF